MFLFRARLFSFRNAAVSIIIIVLNISHIRQVLFMRAVKLRNWISSPIFVSDFVSSRVKKFQIFNKFFLFISEKFHESFEELQKKIFRTQSYKTYTFFSVILQRFGSAFVTHFSIFFLIT